MDQATKKRIQGAIAYMSEGELHDYQETCNQALKTMRENDLEYLDDIHKRDWEEMYAMLSFALLKFLQMH